MRRTIFVAGIAAAALIPAMASAQTQSNCERQRSNRVIGTVAGAAVGGVLGNVIAGQGDKTIGTVIGAVGGAVVGNQIAKPSGDCRHAYGYYDENNRWHTTGVNSADARGYYDRNGDWIDGAPNGYYADGNRWVSNSGMQGGDGYYSAQGGWVPASVNGYYDRNDQWVAGSASGYYDSNGRWVAGGTTGHYDTNGRWVAGVASGSRDSNGKWIADAQPGYYDSNGRWNLGQTMGYYDSRGRWISTTAQQGGYDQTGPRGSILMQVSRLEQYVQTASFQHTLNRGQIISAQRELRNIRARERRMRHDRAGYLSARDQAGLQARINRLTNRLRINSF